MRNGKISLNL